MYYYKHHIGDFKRDTDMLTDHQSMVYLRLLWSYYDTEEPLPNDARKLAFMCRSDQETVALILEHFFTLEDGHWKQERCDQEIAQYRSKSEKAKQSASKRWGASAMQTQSDRNANASVSHANASKSDANHKPLTINQEPVTSNQLEKKVSAKANNELLEIFNYWKDVMKKSNSAILNAKRSKAVKARLKEGYSVEQIKQAIEGCAMTPHNMGQNQNGKKYDDLELICRDGVQVERFANNATQQQPRFGQHVSKTLDALNNMEWDDE